MKKIKKLNNLNRFLNSGWNLLKSKFDLNNPYYIQMGLVGYGGPIKYVSNEVIKVLKEKNILVEEKQTKTVTQIHIISKEEKEKEKLDKKEKPPK